VNNLSPIESPSAEDVAAMREEYRRAGLEAHDLDPDPFAQFAAWFQEAVARGVPEPNAMTLATAARDGTPSARVVLLKGFDERGFTFYSNYESRKGRELAENPRAAIVCYWPGLERQVRIGGTVERVSREESEAYFRSRPLGSRLGAWASRQSAPIAGREVLEERLREVEEEFRDGEVPLPPFWGGYRLAPANFEFWQGRPSRLHDRFRYTRDDGGEWTIERLSS
jgi:pyridoxamine 5'-phosphate oxidase